VRGEIVKSALQMFFEKGYDATTVEEIVAAVEVSPSTFYRHFPAKSDVVVEFSRMHLQTLGAAVAERPAEESLSDALAAAIQAEAADVGPDTGSIKQFEDLLAKNAELRGRLLRELNNDLPLIAARIAPRLGLKPADLRTEVVANAISSTIRVSLERWARSTGKQSPFQVLQAAVGILTPLFESVAAG
jgi:AcrR family transcriptional regulator